MPKFTTSIAVAKSQASGAQKMALPTPFKPAISGATPTIVKPNTSKPSIGNKIKSGLSHAVNSVEHGLESAAKGVEHGVESAFHAVEKGTKVVYHDVVDAAKSVEKDAGDILSSPVKFLRNNLIIFGVIAIGGIYFVSKANQPALSSLAANAKFIPI